MISHFKSLASVDAYPRTLPRWTGDIALTAQDDAFDLYGVVIAEGSNFLNPFEVKAGAGKSRQKV